MSLRKQESKDIYCLLDGEKKKFIPILNKNNDSILNLNSNISISDLKDEMIYGKILVGIVGYNPIGWWKYIYIKKQNLFN
tara:strand:+ start:224 stop:463 length:240 start_codon:yes stop_codon:yes gene_type:complete